MKFFCLCNDGVSYTFAWSSLVEGGKGSYLPNCQTTLVIALDALSLLFCIFINTTAYHLGRYEPSPPSTKELHDFRLKCFQIWVSVHHSIKIGISFCSIQFPIKSLGNLFHFLIGSFPSLFIFPFVNLKQSGTSLETAPHQKV